MKKIKNIYILLCNYGIVLLLPLVFLIPFNFYVYQLDGFRQIIETYLYLSTGISGIFLNFLLYDFPLLGFSIAFIFKNITLFYLIKNKIFKWRLLYSILVVFWGVVIGYLFLLVFSVLIKLL